MSSFILFVVITSSTHDVSLLGGGISEPCAPKTSPLKLHLSTLKQFY